MLRKTPPSITSRSFPNMVPDFETLRTSISNFAVRCAEKLRKQQSAASIVSVFIDYDSERYEKMKRLDEVIDRMDQRGRRI